MIWELLWRGIQKLLYKLHLRNILLQEREQQAGSFPGVLFWCHLQYSGPGVCWGVSAIQQSNALLPLHTQLPAMMYLPENASLFFLMWIPSLMLQLKYNAVLLQYCLRNMSRFWTWQVSLFFLDPWQLWHWNVAWTYWTSFPQVLEMTLNNRNNGWWTILEGFVSWHWSRFFLCLIYQTHIFLSLQDCY